MRYTNLLTYLLTYLLIACFLLNLLSVGMTQRPYLCIIIIIIIIIFIIIKQSAQK